MNKMWSYDVATLHSVSYLPSAEIVSDIAIFVLKRDVKLQLTNSSAEMASSIVCSCDVHTRLSAKPTVSCTHL